MGRKRRGEVKRGLKRKGEGKVDEEKGTKGSDGGGYDVWAERGGLLMGVQEMEGIKGRM